MDMVVVDHLQLMRPSTRVKDMREAFTQIGNEMLVDICTGLNVSALCLSQLRKADKRDDKPPTIDDFRETSAFAENAYAAGVLNRPEFFKSNGDRSKVNFSLQKHRGGKTGKVEFRALDQFCRYEVVDSND